MEQKDNLEAICNSHFGQNSALYSALKDFIFLNIPVEPDKPYQIACYDKILNNHYPGNESFNYKLAAFVALLNGDYSSLEEYISKYVAQAGLGKDEASNYEMIVANKEKAHDALQEYYRSQLETIKGNVTIEEAVQHKDIDKARKC